MHQNYHEATQKTQHRVDHFFSSKANGSTPVAISNCRVRPGSAGEPEIPGGGANERRIRFVLEHFAKIQEKNTLHDALKESLSIEPVNRIFTFQIVSFTPRTRAVGVRFDNAFAADGQLHQIKFFSQDKDFSGADYSVPLV